MVWRWCDGKAGHERQTAGLLKHLGNLRELSVHELAANTLRFPLWHWLRNDFAPLRPLPKPDLLVGAGRACQWPMLAAQRAAGGRTLYCMKPYLPTWAFDLCLVPRHDGAELSPHVEPTQGVLNDVSPRDPTSGQQALILIGGPSRHHTWDEAALLRQVASIVFGSSTRAMVIMDSRRTPASTSARLAEFVQRGVEFHAHHTTSPTWILDKLHTAREAWVTADSVSMLSEALTAGLAVGVIDVPARRADRITRLADQLTVDGDVISLSAWLQGQPLKPRPQPLAEARRCAALVAARWFPQRGRSA